jgi:hypothetical protein
MSKEELADIKTIKTDMKLMSDNMLLTNAEIERMNNHIRIFKGYGKTLDSIETAILGSSLNGNDGLLSKINKINQKIDEYETMKTQFNVAKWVFGIFASAIIVGYVSELYHSKEEKKQEIENIKQQD